MEICNKPKAPQDADLRATLDFLQKTRETLAELRLDRGNAARAEQPKLALQLTKDLCQCHRDRLHIGFRLISVRRSLFYNRAKKQGPGSARYQFLAKFLGPEAGERASKEWQEANKQTESPDSADDDEAGKDPLSAEDLTIEIVRNEFVLGMAEERSFLENLQRGARQAGNMDLVQGCRKELRELDMNLLERQMEISSYEKDNPAPVDPYRRQAEIMAARVKFVSIIEEVAIKRGILSEDGSSLPVPEPSGTPEL